MRIGYLTYGLDRAPTGIGRYAVELMRAFEQLADPPEIYVLARAEDNQRIDILLYANDGLEPYRQLRLWADV